jgi:predicted metal-dependent phosphoesterase TrpH
VISGIEISVSTEGGTLHILGYGINHHEEKFAAAISRLQKARADRNPRIVRNLQEMGIPINSEQVEAAAGSGQIGRPHMAEVLVELGAVSSVQEAFDRYLASDAPAYEHKFRYEPETAFKLILGAGGIPVMAHPYQTGKEGEELQELVANLKGLGLEGIEVYYSHHTPRQTEYYRELADRFDLVETGGTDYHGERKKDIQLGWGKGNLRVPVQLLEEMDRRIARLREI